MQSKLDRAQLELAITIQDAKTRQDVQRILLEFQGLYDLATVAYFGQNIKPETDDDPYLAVTYSPAWVEHYIKQDYVDIDPIVQHGFSSVLPIEWNNFDRNAPKVKRFFGEAEDFGLGINGVTIPVRGRGGDRALFTVTKNASPAAWAKDLTLLMRDFQIIAYQIHDTVCRIEGLHHPEYRLAPRERECLKWACRGKTVAETATILSLSERTVRFYLDLARSKMNATNIAHAVSKAVSAGTISTL